LKYNSPPNLDSGTFKEKIALEALKGEKTIAQLASDYGVHWEAVPPSVRTWQVVADWHGKLHGRRPKSNISQV
jgi:transposase-like protein